MGSIMFCDSMMRALLAGRKTVTRRMRPKGKAGDLLWVREGLRMIHLYLDAWGSMAYSADGEFVLGATGIARSWPWKRPNLPSIYCPRWASRVTIRLLDVREERLNEITEEDARREGFECRAEFLALFGRLHPELAGTDPIVYRHEFEVAR